MSYKEVPKVGSNPFSMDLWVAWIAGLLGAAIAATTFLYTNFETKSDSDERNARIEKHLDRIETKLDEVILKRSR